MALCISTFVNRNAPDAQIALLNFENVPDVLPLNPHSEKELLDISSRVHRILNCETSDLGSGSDYLGELCRSNAARSGLLSVARNFGDRAFAVAGPASRNRLPASIQLQQGRSLCSGRALYVLLERPHYMGEKLNAVTNTVGNVFPCFILYRHCDYQASTKRLLNVY